ncbi:MAG TPA: DUF4350 domain-containing protein, partial [Thermoanaerobaculia bacterium]|nr:DUF4350 domain-containing protein [Thermoanaerobaculia bacterium]
MSRGLRLAALAAALYLAGVAVWVRYDRRSIREVFEPGSVFNSGEEGLSLALAYLRERAGTATTLHGRVEAAGLPENAVVLRVQPVTVPFLPQVEEEEDKDEKYSKDGKDAAGKDDKPAKRRWWQPENRKSEEEPKKKEKEAESEETPVRPPRLLTSDEEAWVRAGGRLVFAFSGIYGPASTTALPGRQPVRKVFPLWPGVARLVTPIPRALELPPLPEGHAVFLAGDSPLLYRLPLGEGDVIFLSTPEILENNHLGQAHHLALLEALAGVRERRPVFFDERSHGLADSGGILETLAGWGLGPLLLLGLLVTGAAFWRSSVRLGPPEREERDTRSDAVELLDSLADLYDRALQRADAVRLYHESFLHTLAVETGSRGPALQQRAQTLLDGFVLPAPGEDLSRERF